MKYQVSNRQFLSAAIIAFYLIPLLFLAFYNIGLMPPQKNWTFLSIGFFLVACGTLILILLLYYWEEAIQIKKHHNILPLPEQLFYTPIEKETKVTSLDPGLTFSYPEKDESIEPLESTKELNLLQNAIKESQERLDLSTKALEHKNRELQEIEKENEKLTLKAQQIAQDFSDYKLFSEEQLRQKQLQLSSLQQIVEDQRTEMEKRQEQIHQLDTKVHDLSYEIKTLLYLNEEAAPAPLTTPKKEWEIYEAISDNQFFAEEAMRNPHDSVDDDLPIERAISTPIEATNLLKKCINIAQKLTGANYFSNESSRYREFSSSYCAIDQRRLFDSLRGENGALILVYSQKDHKVLFVNNQSKNLLGWSPEKFVSDFSSIIQEGLGDWKKALSTLSGLQDSQAQLLVKTSQARFLAKTKQGQEIILNCHLGVIPTGLFRNYIIGVLYPT